MTISNQDLKPEMDLSQYLNYLALTLIHLAGNDMPLEEDIQKIERKLKLIIKEYTVQKTT